MSLNVIAFVHKMYQFSNLKLTVLLAIVVLEGSLLQYFLAEEGIAIVSNLTIYSDSQSPRKSQLMTTLFFHTNMDK